MKDCCYLLPDGFGNYFKPVKLSPVKESPIVEVVYVYVGKIQTYQNWANKFLASYQANPPGYPHRTTIACNNGAPNGKLLEGFKQLPECTMMPHDNSGYDIGAYQHAAKDSTADLMLFLSASTYFQGPNWLKRIVESYVKHGDALYGTMGNRGDAHVGVNRHIRSTAFWMTPGLFNQYPVKVNATALRYTFEHKPECITEWCLSRGIKAWVVSWNGEYEWEHWDDFPNGFHRGDQSQVMIGDHINLPPYYPR